LKNGARLEVSRRRFREMLETLEGKAKGPRMDTDLHR
jgi:hypothetical protein